METTAKWNSPQSVTGSLFLAVFAHSAIYGGVLLAIGLGWKHAAEKPHFSDEVAYETFSEPPIPVKEVRPVAKTPEPETPDEPDQTPDAQPKEMHDDSSQVAGTQAAAKPVATTGAQGVGEAVSTPYYKIKPKYPRAALVSGIEGFVVLKIDVNEKGEVENVRVVGGQQRQMFQDEARRAVEKWKYRPFLDANGKSIKKADHEVRVDFKLQDASA